MTPTEKLLRDALERIIGISNAPTTPIIPSWRDCTKVARTALAATAPDTAVPAKELIQAARRKFASEMEHIQYLESEIIRLSQVPEQSREPVASDIMAFVYQVIDDCFDGTLESAYIQEVAVKHGLLKSIMRAEPCGETCACAEMTDFPTECFAKTYLAAPTAQGDEVRGQSVFDRTTAIHKAARRTLSRAEFAMMERLYDLVTAPTGQSTDELIAERDTYRVAYYGALKELTTAPTAKAAEPVNLNDIEQYRLQMVAIQTAALGYWKDGDRLDPDYMSVALPDVTALYRKYDALHKAHTLLVAAAKPTTQGNAGQVPEDKQ